MLSLTGIPGMGHASIANPQARRARQQTRRKRHPERRDGGSSTISPWSLSVSG